VEFRSRITLGRPIDEPERASLFADTSVHQVISIVRFSNVGSGHQHSDGRRCTEHNRSHDASRRNLYRKLIKFGAMAQLWNLTGIGVHGRVPLFGALGHARVRLQDSTLLNRQRCRSVQKDVGATRCVATY
jgi:hypothetical protein